MTEWFDQEAFWQDVEPFIFGADRREQASQETERILALMGLPSASHILDMACGIGRHSVELAGRGHQVTGVDRTARYIDKARAAAAAESRHAEWVVADMRAFRRPDTFDAALSLYTSFGYFDDPADDRRVLENLFISLKPGGYLLMDLLGKEVLARIFRPREWEEGPGGVLWLKERKLSRDWGWVEVRWVFIRGEDRREHTFAHRIYSAAELRRLVSSVGFEEIEVFGTLDGAPYDHEAKRLVLRAHKPSR